MGPKAGSASSSASSTANGTGAAATPGAPGTPGIDGGLGGAANELKGTVNTVDVVDLDEALKKVAANGGQVVAPKDEIPGVGWLAYVREPGGAVLGLIQSLPNAQM